MKAAINWIKSIASEPEVGHIYEGTVVKVMDFGAFVNFFGAKDGLVHISQLAQRRVQKTSDVVKEGDKVKVKLLGFDERGKIAPVDEGRRPGDRRGPRSQAEGRGRACPRRSSAGGGGRRIAAAAILKLQGRPRGRPFSWSERPAVPSSGPISRSPGRAREPQWTARDGRRRIVLGVPLGAGAAHVMALGPVGIEQASQRPAEVGKIARQGRALRVGARLRLLDQGLFMADLIACVLRNVLARDSR